MREYAINYTGGDIRFSTFAAIVVAVPIANLWHHGPDLGSAMVAAASHGITDAIYRMRHCHAPLRGSIYASSGYVWIYMYMEKKFYSLL